MNLRRVTDEVFVAEETIVRFGAEEVAFVKERAAASPRRRARICAHKSDDADLQEMLIAVSRDSYVHPHRHVGRPESFHIVEGEVDVVLLDGAGEITGVVELGEAASGRAFFYRLPDGFHTLLIRTAFLVVHEITTGPFRREGSVLAPFAPPETQPDDARRYIAELAGRAGAHARRAEPDSARTP